MVQYLKHFVLLTISLIVIFWSGITVLSPSVSFAGYGMLPQNVRILDSPSDGQLATCSLMLRPGDIFVDENSGMTALLTDLTKLVCKDFLFSYRNSDSDAVERQEPLISIPDTGGWADRYGSDYYTIGLLKIVI